MKVAVIGTGYVGLVSGTCFSVFGADVTCVDLDLEKVDKLRRKISPIYENGLDDLISNQVDANRLHFTTDLKSAVQGADAIFIAVGTPPMADDGRADLTFVYQVARDIAKAITGYTVIVTKSTVPVGTAREIQKIISTENPDADFEVCSNPEFLREGAAIQDFMNPDRVVIGLDTHRAQKILKNLYQPLLYKDVPIIFTTPESAEIAKYASNAFLATKITFINEIANLCEKTNANVDDVSVAMGLDARIGSKFLRAGPGYGGSCFPKDAVALTQTGQHHNAPQTIIEAVVKTNNYRQHAMAERIIEMCNGDVRGKKIGILGVAFKPKTDDVRDSPAIVIIQNLQKMGARISANDPAAQEQATKILNDIDWRDNAYDVAQDADAVVVVTEWDDYKTIDLKRLGSTMKSKNLADFRNIYDANNARELGFNYISIGRM